MRHAPGGVGLEAIRRRVLELTRADVGAVAVKPDRSCGPSLEQMAVAVGHAVHLAACGCNDIVRCKKVRHRHVVVMRAAHVRRHVLRLREEVIMELLPVRNASLNAHIKQD